MQTVRIAGAGAFVPKRMISNERIAKAIPGWTAERIEERTGIRERRFLWDFDTETGKAIPPPRDAAFYPSNNSEMCEVALREALENAALDARELDAIYLVTCTPDRPNFNHDAMRVHEKLGCRADTFALTIDDGCGGTPYVLDLVRRMVGAGAFRHVAVIASSFASPAVDRTEYTAELAPEPGRKTLSGYLSMYVFGDGAGAVVLSAGSGPGEIVRSFSGNAHGELVIRRGGGQLVPPFGDRAQAGDMAFVVDGHQVAKSYPEYMNRCLAEVAAGDLSRLNQVKRFYFHQPNKRLMDHYVEGAGLGHERVACNVDRYGNTSAAGMLILLAEDLRNGTVRAGSGDLAVIAAVGANIHYGAQLVRL